MRRHFNAYPDFDQIFRRFAIVGANTFSLRKLVYRSSEPIYATENDLLTGEGSRRHGGRWNPPRSFATVYAALSDTTALAESKASHLYYGLDPAEILPRTFVAIDVVMGAVLDLGNGVIRKTFGVSAARMRNDDWRAANRRGDESLTQAIGRAAYESGIEGILVPACDRGRNLVWFPGNLKPPSNATIRNVDKLS